MWKLRSVGIVLCVVVLTASTMACGAYQATQEAKGQAQCQNHLKQFGLIYKMFMNENRDTGPTTISGLYPDYLSDLGICVCPATEDQVGDFEDPVNNHTNIDEWSSYELVPDLGSTEHDEEVVVVREKEYNHWNSDGWFRHVVYLDGHIGREAAE